MTLTVGIVGCGEITDRARAEQIHEAEGMEVGMTMDVEAWAAEDVAERYGVPHTTEEAAVLSNPGIDAVYISTPHHLHAEQAIRAARAGKHVVVEKPIATTAADAREVIEVCEEEGVRLSVPLMRFTPGVDQAKAWVEDGLIGDLVGTRIVRMGRKPDSYWRGGYSGRVETEWRQHADRAGGGVLLMNNVHDVDRLRYVTGLEAERVYAEADTFVTDVEVEDFVCVTIRYASGAIGNVESSSFLEAGFEGGPYDRIYGEEGTIVLADPLRVRTEVETELGAADTWHEVPAEPPATEFFPAFARAVETGSEVPVSGEDALRALEIVLGAYESAETHRPVELPL